MSDRFLNAKIAGSLDSKLKLREFVGSESVSSLFRYDLTFVAEASIARSELEQQLLGKDVTVTITLPDAKRHFSGMICDVATQAVHDGQVEYHATMVPFLWFLSRISDCRVFQNKKTTEIVKEVIGDEGKVVDKTNGGREWPYCVQYRETKLNFVSRLLEEDGIFYYFKHAENSHELVLGDSNSHFLEATGKPLDLSKGTDRDSGAAHELGSWRMDLNTVSGKWAHGDYNFEDAKTKLLGENPSGQKVPKAKKYELYDYPGEFFDKGGGDSFAKYRAEEIGVGQASYSADGCSTDIQAGKRFKLGDNPHPGDAKAEFVALGVSHHARATDFAQDSVSASTPYSNQLQGIKFDCPYRPRRSTSKPSVNGLQSAVVVGPDSDEIYTDEYGRVKVRFHWDRWSEKPDDCSCFIRVAQLMAGREWGSMAIPRIGQEVVIDFLDGDPDRPLIIGSVYNSDQKPAYNPKEMASRIYLKSNSSKEGNGFNEIMLDDRKDSERLFLHAQKDMDVRVRNDAKEWIYGNRHEVVGLDEDGNKAGSKYYRVAQDNQIHVERHQDEHIEGNYRLLVGAGSADDGGKVAAIVDKSVAIKVGSDGLTYHNEGDVKEKIDGTVSSTIGGDEKVEIGGGLHHKIAGDHNEKAANFSLELDQMANIKGGMKVAVEGGNEVHIKSGTSLCIEAGAMLTLKVGGNFININPAGVFIQGTIVGINSGGAAGPGTGCMPMPPMPPDPVTSPPEQAEPTKPEDAHKEKTGYPSK